jgi:hypothetical protein
MVMDRINDRGDAANMAAENNEIERASNTGEERDLLAELEASDIAVIAALPTVEHAAAKRVLVSALRRATAAAERLSELEGTGTTKPPTERNEEPPGDAQITSTLPPPFAIMSNGRVLLNVAACPDIDLKGREMFLGFVLAEEEEAFATRKLEDVVHDVAGHLGGMIKRHQSGEGSGSDGNG